MVTQNVGSQFNVEVHGSDLTVVGPQRSWAGNIGMYLDTSKGQLTWIETHQSSAERAAIVARVRTAAPYQQGPPALNPMDYAFAGGADIPEYQEYQEHQEHQEYQQLFPGNHIY
jgi:hypothetical protein